MKAIYKFTLNNTARYVVVDKFEKEGQIIEFAKIHKSIIEIPLNVDISNLLFDRFGRIGGFEVNKG